MPARDALPPPAQIPLTYPTLTPCAIEELDCRAVRRGRLLLVALLALGCIAVLPAASAVAKTKWLCKPGRQDACSTSLSTTSFSPNGKRLGVQRIKRPRHPKFDCFYVYPTVSDQKSPVADFSIDPEQRSIALYQAARYGSECRIFAPVYRQLTLQGISGAPVTPAQRATAYNDVRDAWRDYLKNYNHGRGVVLIGHSQGTFVLRQLVTEEIDRKPAVRERLISAVLLGGNVVVKKGKDVGGDFKKVPACRSRTQTGCVIAFSTFDEPPPADAIFGRSGDPKLDVLCTNPAALRGGQAAKITPIQPAAPFAPGTTIGAVVALLGTPTPAVNTAWRAFPGSYRARCSSAGGAHVLSITPIGAAPLLRASPTPQWGLHLVDANIALGELVSVVRSQGAAWLRRH
jgi:hypothetical protein